MSAPTPTKTGKFLAFLHKENPPIYLYFDAVGSTDGKNYWHREGSNDSFHPVGFIESPFKREPSHTPDARTIADEKPVGPAHVTDSKPVPWVSGDAGH